MNKRTSLSKKEIFDALENGELDMGKAVRLLRKNLGFTQEQYSKMIGIDKRVLVGFELNTGNLTQEKIAAILLPFGLILTARRKKY